MKKIYKALPAIVFCGFIAVMLALFLILPKKDFSPSEKRVLENAPELTLNSYFSEDKESSFQKKFETFISDHTAGRNFWVGFNAYFNLALGNNSAPKGVYYGKDDYLINDPADLTDLALHAGYMEEFAEDVKTRLNVPVTVAVAPSTGYVCEDKLPNFHYTYQDEEAFAQMKDIFKTAGFVDLRDCLKAAYKDGSQVFYRTDHHWTAKGAYTAYCELGKALGYAPNSEDKYEKTSYPGFYGTTYSTSGFWGIPADDIEIWDNKSNDGGVFVSIDDGFDENGNRKLKELDDMFFYDHLNEDDKYPVYLDGNHPYTVIRNEKADSDKKLVVVKDSFAHSLVPFLADHFKEIIMVDLRYYGNSVSAIIEREKADQVLVLYSLDNLATDVVGVPKIG